MIEQGGEKISILGVTGSIGQSTIKVIESCEKKYDVQAITANSNVEELARLAKKLKCKMAVIADKKKYSDLQKALSGTNIKIAAGKDALVEAAAVDSDVVMSAIVGSAGLMPTLKAVERGAKVALANKESLVCAGDIIMSKASQTGAKIIPVDSEHSAIFQTFENKNQNAVDKITLTASGGPFRKQSLEFMKTVTPKQAVSHPNWSMGHKISIDSATMMNKGLEIIEAYHLFPVKAEQIDVVVHPESIIHSMVEYKDGSVLAQLGSPDMCTPISVALSWPQRFDIDVQRLNLAKISTLNFEEVDNAKFPCVNLAYEALKIGGLAPAILNSANEVAVHAFLNGQISFLEIASIVQKVLNSTDSCKISSIEDVLLAIEEAECKAKTFIEKSQALSG